MAAIFYNTSSLPPPSVADQTRNGDLALGSNSYHGLAKVRCVSHILPFRTLMQEILTTEQT